MQSLVLPCCHGDVQAHRENRVTVILASGAAPTHEIPLSHLRTADGLVACDGAWRTAVALGRMPDAVVGDGDSLGGGDREELAALGIPLVIDSEQDTNDLCKAFRHVMSKSSEDGDGIVILGATGKRDDHMIGNIFHLADFAMLEPDVSIVTDSGVFEPLLPPGRSWPAYAGMPVSVFAPFPDTEIGSEGLEWKLDGVSLKTLWSGTLNRATGDSFSLRTNNPAIVYRPHRGCVR